MTQEERVKEMAAWMATRKSTALSGTENLLTDTENSMKIPSSSKSVSLHKTNSDDETVIFDRKMSRPSTKEYLPDEVVQRYVNIRESLRRSKPPFGLLRLVDKPETKTSVSPNLTYNASLPDK